MRRLIILPLLVAAAVGLAACGGSDEGESAAPPAEAAATTTAATDIVDTAVAAGDFTTLATALEAAGLVETLKGDGPFTVFAPTDEAFAKLPAATLNELLLPENKDQLSAILTYHVAEGEVASTDLVDGQAIPTVQGGEALVAISEDGTVTVDDATVTAADVMASNGVIHVIDTVLLPPEG
jgi:uncharacterized surface protein with fasciclin (FAS1) repeats